jgi:hypothetical protein
MSHSDIVASAPGPAAGYVSESLATGSVAAGLVALVTGGDTSDTSTPTTAPAPVLVGVTFSTDANAVVPVGTAFTVTQVTGNGLGATLAHTVVVTPEGFEIVPTAVPAADTMYVFAWSS